MGIVYSNSTLNIAAAAAPNGSFGCFTPKTPDQVYGCKVAIWETHRPRQTKDNIWDIRIEYMTAQIMRSVLDTRGWVFQERFFAPRTLYFTSYQLFWECVSSKACEPFPDSFHEGTHTLPAIKFDNGNLPDVPVARKWRITACECSVNTTTFPKDRLIAFSGIARLFATRFGTTYLAGLWKEDLIFQSAWVAPHPSHVEFRGPIPSWSWASVSALTDNIFDGNWKDPSPLVSILEANTVVVDDEFGDVQEGTIRIICRLPIIADLVKEKTAEMFSFQ